MFTKYHFSHVSSPDLTNSNPHPSSEGLQFFLHGQYVYLPYFPPKLQGLTYICDYSKTLTYILVWEVNSFSAYFEECSDFS